MDFFNLLGGYVNISFEEIEEEWEKSVIRGVNI